MTDVFISYSRKDIAFARLIRESLQQSEIDTWIDWERIPIGEKWWTEICGAIQAANTFVFIVSQNSIGSAVCKDEINLALENHKRIIPIVVDDLKPEVIREFIPDLPQFNWIVFEKDHIFQLAENPAASFDRPDDQQVALPKLPQFEQALGKLSAAIHTDWDWVKTHTRLQVDALHWDQNQRNPSYLLRGEELEDAEELLLRGSGKNPQPTGLQVEFITASRQEETRRQQEDRRTQEEKLRAEQKASRRQKIAIWAVGLGLFVAVGLGVVAWGQRNGYLNETHVRATAESDALAEASNRATAESNAVHQQGTAEAASTLAVQQRDEAVRQSKLALAAKLAAQSQMLGKDQIDLALLLGVEASLAADTTEAMLSPRLALEVSPRLHRIVNNDFFGERPFAISPDGGTLAIGECIEIDTTNPVTTCKHSRVLFANANTGQAAGGTLDLGKFIVRYLAYNKLDGGKTLILVGNQSIAIWDIEKGSPVGEYPTGQMETRLLPGVAAFSPDGKLLALGSCADRSKGGDANGYCNLGEIRLWSIETRQLVGKPIAAHETDIHTLAFRPDSQAIASTGDRTIKLWTLPSPAGPQEGKLIGSPFADPDIVNSALAFSPDGRLLASGGSGNTISLRNITSPDEAPVKLMGHTYWVSALDFSPDGKTLASGGWDDTVMLWDVASRQPIGAPHTGHAGDVLGVLFSSDSQQLISTDRQGTLILWDTSSQFAGSPLGRMIPSGQPYSFVRTHAFSPDGNILAYCADRTIFLWDIRKNQPLGAPLTGHHEVISSLVFPPQDHGRTLVSADRDHASITWDVVTGKPIHSTGQDQDTLIQAPVFSQDGSRLIHSSNRGVFIRGLPEGTVLQKLSVPAAGDRVDHLEVTPDGSLVVVSACETLGANGNCSGWFIQAWDVASDSPAGPAIRGLSRWPSVVAMSADGKALAYSLQNEGKIWIRDRLTGQAIREIPMLAKDPSGHGWLSGLTFSPDGKLLAASSFSDQMLTLWDIASGQMAAKPFMDQFDVQNPTFSPDGKVLAWPLDGAPFLWDIEGQKPLGQSLHNGDASGSLFFSPDGQRIAISGGVKTGLVKGAQVFDAHHGAPIMDPLIGHVSNVVALAFNADGQQLYTLSSEGTLDIWDLARQSLIAEPLAGYLANYAEVDLSPDGRTMAIVACREKPGDDCITSELWMQDTQTGEMHRQSAALQGETTLARFSQDESLLAIVSGEKAILWSVTDRKELVTMKSSVGPIEALAFSPDGHLLAIKAKAIQLFDTRSGALVGQPIFDTTIDGNDKIMSDTGIRGVAFSPDGRWLVTQGNVSGSLLLVDAAAGQPFGPLLINPSNQLMKGMTLSVSFSPDGHTLAVGNNLGTASLWNVDPVAWRELACATAGRKLSPEEWSIYMPDSEPYRLTCP